MQQKAIVEPAPIHPIKFEKRFDFEPDGTTVKKESIWCTWAKKGTGIAMETTDKVERMKRDPAVWRAIEPFYNAWLEGNSREFVDGTPLSVWPGMEPHVVDLLKSHKVFSVEDFARMSDGDVGKLGFPGARDQRDRAREYLKNKSSQDQVSELQRRIAELEAAAAEKDDQPKRGPGRPRKDEAA